MFGIQWSENEQNILFPEMENSKQPDVLQVNSIVCMGEEDDNQEEDVRPYNDLNYVTNCSNSFSSMSVYSSSASNSCLELSPILGCCSHSIACFDPPCLVMCDNCGCLNYEDYRYCIHCLGLIKVFGSQNDNVGPNFVNFNLEPIRFLKTKI